METSRVDSWLLFFGHGLVDMSAYTYVQQSQRNQLWNGSKLHRIVLWSVIHLCKIVSWNSVVFSGWFLLFDNFVMVTVM